MRKPQTAMPLPRQEMQEIHAAAFAISGNKVLQWLKPSTLPPSDEYEMSHNQPKPLDQSDVRTSGPVRCARPCLLYPQERTFAAHYSMWANGQKRTSLFDHIIGAGEDRRRYGQADRLCCLQIDDQLKFRRKLHRKLGRFGTL